MIRWLLVDSVPVCAHVVWVHRDGFEPWSQDAAIGLGDVHTEIAAAPLRDDRGRS